MTPKTTAITSPEASPFFRFDSLLAVGKGVIVSDEVDEIDEDAGGDDDGDLDWEGEDGGGGDDVVVSGVDVVEEGDGIIAAGCPGT